VDSKASVIPFDLNKVQHGDCAVPIHWCSNMQHSSGGAMLGSQMKLKRTAKKTANTIFDDPRTLERQQIKAAGGHVGAPATDDSLNACCLRTALDLLLHLAVKVLDGLVIPLDHLQVRHQRAQAGDLLCLRPANH